MGFYHSLVVSATVTMDCKEKDNRFDNQKKDLSWQVELDSQAIPKGNKQVVQEVCNNVWVNMDMPKTRDTPDFLKKGQRILMNLRLTGATKTDAAPNAYYLKATEVEALTQEDRSINQFFGKGKIERIAESKELPGTMKILCKEPKRAFGSKKPDWQTPAGWHYYLCVANMMLDLEVYKPGAYFYFNGRLAKNVFPLDGSLTDDQKKRLQSPVILLEKAIY
jgi:hypothetical protein